jgi:transcriptional regulator with GAF, ATPase, and Fis domain
MDQAKRLKDLERENGRLKRVVAVVGRQSTVREFASWAERLVDFKERNPDNGNGNGDPSDAQERLNLLDVLTRHGWNQRAAARELQLSEGGVRHMMRRHKIERPVEQISHYATRLKLPENSVH